MNKRKVYDFIFRNKVVILFVVLCIGASIASKQSLTFIVSELFNRIARNSFLVLSLIIPVLAGMGLNFGIVIGAMAAQTALFLTTDWGLTGLGGFLLTVLLSTPISVLLGFLVGKLFNKMKGTEMIGGLVLGYFAEGFYQFLFLFIFGGVIAVHNQSLMTPTGVGVKNTLDLMGTVRYALDDVPMLLIVEAGFYVFLAITILSAVVRLVKKMPVDWKTVIARLAGAVIVYLLTYIPAVESFLSQERLLLLSAVEIGCAATVLWQLLQLIFSKTIKKKTFNGKKAIVWCLMAAIIYGLTYVPPIYNALVGTRLPVLTYLCIAGLCFFNSALMKTRLGQNMRTVGQSRAVANAAGINVDRTRIIAMIFSTVLAGWGQLIFLQNVGSFSTYGAHTQVGQFAIASLLVGGASVQKATNKQAILGVILFHTMFIVAPLAGRELFGDAAIGEYFRVFISYGVIALALAMHAWKKIVRNKDEKEKEAEAAA